MDIRRKHLAAPGASAFAVPRVVIARQQGKIRQL